MTVQKQRRIENKVVVIGEVKEFEVKSINKPDKPPMKSLRMQIQTSEGETHRIDKFAMKYFERDGQQTENKAYKAIETIEEEYTSLKDVAEGKAEKATVVKVNGSLVNNIYKNNQGQVVVVNQIDGGYINRLDTYDKEAFGAEFTLQGFVTSKGIRLVDKEGEETEEVKISIATIDYRGQAHVFDFVANNEYGVANWLEEEAELGMTLIISGPIINKYLITKVERANPLGIGKAIVDTKREVERKMIIEGIIPIEDEDSHEYITPKEQQEALKKFEAEKVEVKSSVQKKNTATKGVQQRQIGVQGVQKPVTSQSTPLQGVNSEDLPF